jgi:hypothetical protein
MFFVRFIAPGRKPEHGGALRASKKFVGIFVGISLDIASDYIKNNHIRSPCDSAPS